jgi:mRNA interferase YafQ
MKKPAFTNQFQKDMKLAEKRGLDLSKIKAVMFDIICENTLPPKNKNHPLTGDWTGHLECHVEPDWLLIYFFVDDEVRFVRTGSHSDLY